MKLFIGLMSGTSMDGIDAALVDVSTNTLIAGITRPYSDDVMRILQNVLSKEYSRVSELSQLNTLLGREFSLAVFQLLDTANIKPQSVVAIGSHGQTICHDAMAKIPYTMQLACAHTIAELTGIKVVADFRTRDLIIGGQGAPFAPIYHQALFGEHDSPLVVVNIGGVANVTYLEPGGRVSGYDVGPGNCLLDSWIKMHLDLDYDKDGAWAASGAVIVPLLSALLDDPFFKCLPPKSIGKEYFSIDWLSNHLQPHYAPQDVQATLLALTAEAIAADIKIRHLAPQWVAICGGGVHNTALQNTLIKQLPNSQVKSTKVLGVDPDFLEAMMFAWLADKALNLTPLNFRQITGAKHKTVYGAIYAAGIDKGNKTGV